MNSYNINSTAEEGNDLTLTPSQLNKPDNEASLHHDAVFGEISDEGPDYRSVSRICDKKNGMIHRIDEFFRSDSSVPLG